MCPSEGDKVTPTPGLTHFSPQHHRSLPREAHPQILSGVFPGRMGFLSAKVYMDNGQCWDIPMFIFRSSLSPELSHIEKFSKEMIFRPILLPAPYSPNYLGKILFSKGLTKVRCSKPVYFCHCYFCRALGDVIPERTSSLHFAQCNF